MSKLPKLLERVPSNLTDHYEVLELLGEGNFAKVKKGRHKASGQYVAIKFIDKKQIISDHHQLASLFFEINILKSVKHPHIIRLLDVYETSDKLCLITELATGGELFDRIVERGSYSERDASLLMSSLLNALKYLHSNSIAHRDLKPENLLYESTAPGAAIKISDFGLSKVMDKKSMLQTCCGTPGYIAPEILSNTGYGTEVDLWSMGVLLYVLLCGFPPFYNENEAALFAQIREGRYQFYSPYWDRISAEAKDLVSKLLVVDPKERFTAEQALKHSWFSVALPTHKLDEAFQKLSESRSRRKLKAAGMAATIITPIKSKKK